ncbi:glycosyltransferase, partial [Candidatus Bathyarchaeota archaeon]|nr:glycosyltransferase [Candidatus Bathyarchaeota archaeon]
MSQRILMVLADKGFPPDIRVEKEALVLSHYHKVYILTQRRFKEPEEEKINGFIILRRLLLHKYMPKPVSYLHMTFQLMYQLIQICIKENIDIIHVHDLPCAGPVILISKILGKPTIIDMHEHFIEMTRPSLGRSIKSRLFLYCLCLLETISCRYSKRIIVVVEENAKRIIQRGVSPNKVIVVSNTPIINDLKKISETFKKNEKIKDHCIISYIGGFSKHRGLDTLIRALPLVIQKSQKIHVLLVGDGELKAILEQMVDEFRLRDYVT